MTLRPRGVVTDMCLDLGHASNLDLEQKWPAFAIQDGTKKFPFPQDDEITQSSISAFLEEYVNGRLQPSIKSEPLPAEGQEKDGNVRIVVAKNYEDVVLDDNKDVLIEFYAPWVWWPLG